MNDREPTAPAFHGQGVGGGGAELKMGLRPFGSSLSRTGVETGLSTGALGFTG